MSKDSGILRRKNPLILKSLDYNYPLNLISLENLNPMILRILEGHTEITEITDSADGWWQENIEKPRSQF